MTDANGILAHLARGALAAAGVGLLAALVGSCAELARFGWEPPVILAGTVAFLVGMVATQEAGDIAVPERQPEAPAANEPPPMFPDPRG